MANDNEDRTDEEPKWWDSESQYLLDSQQLVEGLSLCDEFLQSQSPNREENINEGGLKGKLCLSDYAQLGAEDLKKDLEECQNLVLDPANIELDTPPEFRLSQLVPSLFHKFVFHFRLIKFSYWLLKFSDSDAFLSCVVGIWITRKLHCLGRGQDHRLKCSSWVKVNLVATFVKILLVLFIS